MKLRKVLALTLVLVFTILSSGITALAASPTIEDLSKKEERVLWTVNEIQNPDTLISRAKLGIDELADNLGIEAKSTIETTGNILAENHVTSQLLQRKAIDNKQIDTYAVSSVARYVTSHQGQNTGYGSTLVATLYLNTTTVSGHTEICLLYTHDTVYGGGAARLVMSNVIRVEAGGAVYNTSDIFSYPSGSYTLYPNQAGLYIMGGTAFVGLKDYLFFDNGGSIKVEFTVNPAGIVTPNP